MSGKDYREKIKQEMTLLEKILSYIPGYRGYKEKEIRRESDRLVRMESVNKLKEAKNIIRTRLTELADLKKIEEKDISRIDMVLSRLDRIVARIEKAPAGYTGLFDAVKVKEDKLDKVLEHDYSMIEKSARIRDVAKRFEVFESREEWLRCLEELLKHLDELERSFDERTDILRGLT